MAGNNLLTAAQSVTKLRDDLAAQVESEYRASIYTLYPKVLDYFLERGDIGVILVRGYTPGFNDGDPCVHTSFYMTNFAEIAENEELENYLLDEAEFEGYELREKIEKINEGEAKGDSWETTTAFEQPRDFEYDNLMNLVVLPKLEKDYGTNYEVLFVIKGGEIKTFVNDEYDCGY